MVNQIAARARSDELSDHELASHMAAGCPDAFEELYRRHVGAASRVAHAVIGDGEDAADAVADAFARILAAMRAGRLPRSLAFRPYLLRCVRNSAVDQVRRSVRDDRRWPRDSGRSADEPHTEAAAREDSTLVYRAFKTLPERWQWALWLDVVEEMPPRSAAVVLRTSANNASQLAFRARNALAAAYVQAHVKQSVAPDCEFTVEHLGTFVVNRRRSAAAAQVTRHLGNCPACRERLSDVDDLGLSLQRGVVAWPLAASVAHRLTPDLGRAATLANRATETVGSGGLRTHQATAWWHESATGAGRMSPELAHGLLGLMRGGSIDRVVNAVAAGAVAASLSVMWGGAASRPDAASPPHALTEQQAPPLDHWLQSAEAAGAPRPVPVKRDEVGHTPGNEFAVTPSPAATDSPLDVVPGAARPATAASSTATSGADTASRGPGAILPSPALPGLSIPSLSLPTAGLAGVAMPSRSMPSLPLPNLPVAGVVLPTLALPIMAAPPAALPGPALPVVATPALAPSSPAPSEAAALPIAAPAPILPTVQPPLG